MIKRLLCSIVALALGACALTRSPLPPAPAMPAAFDEPSREAAALEPDWWRSFGSADLATLVDAALKANPDLAMAAERVLQAEAQVRIAGATLFPVVDFRVGTTHLETRPDGGDWRRSDVSSGTLSASYEIDVWGKNSAGVSAARSSLFASRYDRETVRLTLVAGVANAYFQVLSLRGRLAIARTNLEIAKSVLAVVESRVRNGVNSALDLARQQAGVYQIQAALPPLELQERQTLFALAILTGRAPEGFDAAGANLDLLAVPGVAPGLPSDLLVRRPDVASAEAQLAAANANIVVARAALFPAISLTGSGGLASEVLFNFLNAPAAALAVGASLIQPIFNGGRLRAQVDVTTSRERELVENYRKFILAALADVESALAAGSRTSAQELLQQQVVEQSRIALRLAEVRYRQGIDDLLTLLDAQRTLFQAEDQLAQIRLARLQASVGLFKALGGGWQMPQTVGAINN